MSASTQFPPFFRLHTDVFVKILELNGNMFAEDEDEDEEDEDAMTTTRFASQVCRIWRHVTLNTPSLWARMIDLDYLQGLQNIEWGKELIRRSKDSLLWIQNGEISWNSSPPSREQRVFFIDIINQNWERVQRLILKGPILDDINVPGGPLHRPAPKLEMLDIQFPGHRKSPDGAARRRLTALFSNNAPALKHFSANYRKVTPDAPWLRNLTSLKLDATYSVFECLMILSTTPDLQYLEIKDFGKVSNPSHCLVSLARLKTMKLTLEFEAMTLLLHHLTVPRECLINLLAYHGRDSESYITPYMLSALSRVLRPYFRSHSTTSLAINCPAKGPITVCDNFESGNKVLELWCSLFEEYPENISSVMKILSFLECPSVTQLVLRCNEIFAEAGLDFLQCFPSVEVLQTHEEIFHYITTAQDMLLMAERRFETLLPKLRIVKLRSPSGTRSDPCALTGHTVDFIYSRIDDGHPISVLDITDCHERTIDRGVVEYLEKNEGLDIISRPSRAAPCFLYYP